jgi:hypothetical protein
LPSCRLCKVEKEMQQKMHIHVNGLSSAEVGKIVCHQGSIKAWYLDVKHVYRSHKSWNPHNSNIIPM